MFKDIIRDRNYLLVPQVNTSCIWNKVLLQYGPGHMYVLSLMLSYQSYMTIDRDYMAQKV